MITKVRIAIPCYNHADKLSKIIPELPENIDILIIDDGSDKPIEIKDISIGDRQRVKILRHEINRGKAEALRSAFRVSENAFTHLITMDSDGQHPPEMLPCFFKEIAQNPHSIIIGTRDFDTENIPKSRRFMNKFSNFWFKVETGEKIDDTQCGFRAYPISETLQIDANNSGFTFEVELLVKAAWSGIDLRQIKIPTVYTAESTARSHYKPVIDTVKFSLMNTRLFFQSVILPKSILKKIALKKK